jgi:hypothetical protein
MEKRLKIAELEAKRDYAWRLFQYYCERLDELRKPPEEPGWKEEVHRIASVIGTKVKEDA